MSIIRSHFQAETGQIASNVVCPCHQSPTLVVLRLHMWHIPKMEYLLVWGDCLARVSRKSQNMKCVEAAQQRRRDQPRHKTPERR